MYYDIQDQNTFRGVLDNLRSKYGEKQLFVWYNASRTEKSSVTSLQFCRQVETLGAYLLSRSFSQKKIAIYGENSYSWLLAFFAITCTGNTAVLMDYNLSAREQTELAQYTDCDAVLFSSRYAQQAAEMQKELSVPFIPLEELPQIAAGTVEDRWQEVYRSLVVLPEDEAVIAFTSSTTGRRKGVVLTQRNITAMAVWDARQAKFDDRYLLFLPVFHIFGLGTVVVAMLWGTTCFINSDLSAFMSNVQEFQPNVLIVVPVMLPILYGYYSQNPPSEKIAIYTGGAATNDDWLKKLRALHICVGPGYGMTECSGAVAAVNELFYKNDSLMKVYGCCEVKIDQPNADGAGEILVRGASVMKGYYKMPEETAEVLRDGWLYTGDIGTLTEDGFLTVVGRKKNLLVLSNGENIPPEPLENQIMSLPGVTECIVVCRGGLLAAEVYAPEGEESAIRSGILALNRTLPGYSQIARIIFRQEPLPKNSVGKILRT